MFRFLGGLSMHWIYAHLIGDYLIQTDWMAQNKKSSPVHCLVHVVTYMIPFLLCGFAWWQMVLIATQHFALDRSNFVVWYMNHTGRGRFADPDGMFFPWSIIVVDNVMHILWIAFVAWLPTFLKGVGV